MASSCGREENQEEEKKWILLELELGEAAESFNLEKAVCSHGLFMMAPNHWDPLSQTLSRPLTIDDRLTTPTNDVMVRISHPSHAPHSLHVRVYAPHSQSLTLLHKHNLLGQVTRMLRLSANDEMNVREFRKIVESIPEEETDIEYLTSYSGRVFRSPTLFEDMVKCILLCNCQWSRTLSMANGLCELQWELQHKSSGVLATEAQSMNSKKLKDETEKFVPKTPARKDVKTKHRPSKISKKLSAEFSQTRVEMQADVDLKDDCEKIITEPPLQLEVSAVYSHTVSDHQFANEKELYVSDRIGNFPCARELANVSETYLAKRCNLGYRAGRIIKLSKAIVEGRIDLKLFEELSQETNMLNYDKLALHLSEIDGFGPFTCANVLMCMGFYHVIPSDSETIRHLKQVHSRNSTIKTIREDVEKIYKKFEPFQFLAYWAEIWNFYETRFGKLSAVPNCDYKLITASNMKSKANSSCKKRTRKK